MNHPRNEFPLQKQMEAKVKSLLMNFLYRMYVRKYSDEKVMKEIARKNLPRMSRDEWWAMKHYFRVREMSTPQAMANIKRKIGVAT